MPRLIDSIRAQGRFMQPYLVESQYENEWAEYARRVWPALVNKDLPVLLIDNVADYYYLSDQEYWDLRVDFPSMAPPFPQFWLEHKMARKIYSKDEGTTDVAALIPHGRVGTLITTLEPSDMVDQFPEEIHADTKWILALEMWIDFGRELAEGPHGATFLCVDADGRLLNVPWMKPFASSPEIKAVCKAYITWLRPALLAVSFLHCKNVAIVDNKVDKPVAKKWHAKTGQWPTPYKTLIIEPLKQILKREGRSGEVGLAKAMHICRGHFADYREGRGLFGKYKKIVWIPSTVKGNKGLKPQPREIEIKVVSALTTKAND